MKKLMNKIRKANKGFTLVELIIVIAIIAILTAVAAPQYLKWVDESRWSQDQNNAQILLTAVQTAAADPSYEVSDTTTVVFDATKVTVTDGLASGATNGLSAYFTELGIDTDLKVTNTGKAAGSDPHEIFTITVTGNKIVGTWSNG